MPESPMAPIVEAINLSAAGESVDFPALRNRVRSLAPTLSAQGALESLLSLLDVIEQDGAEAGKVAMVDVLERYGGALGTVVPRRAPVVREQEEDRGWTPEGPLAFVHALIGDARVGYPVDVEEVRSAIDLVTGLADKLAEKSAPANLIALTRALPEALQLLLDDGADSAQDRLDELALASRSGLLDNDSQT